MKKRLLSAALALLLCLVLLPVSVLAEEFELDTSEPPEIRYLEIVKDGGDTWLEVAINTTSSVRSVMDLLNFFDKSYYISGIEATFSVDGGAWQQSNLTFSGSGSKWSGRWRTEALSNLNSGSWVQAKIRYTGIDDNGAPVLSDWSELAEVNEPIEFNAHDWAKAELNEADKMGLIPGYLRTTDLKLPITRAEFAAVSVKVYEALSGTVAEAAAVNPFTDTGDIDVLKAFNVGITNGVSATEFGPAQLLNREQAATMLARVFKKVSFSGWTLGTDGDFAEQFRALFTMPAAFADDGDISSWARDSVYFMAANGVIKGMEGNTFQPRAVTAEQQAAGYAQATREQAILIAVRLVKNLGA